MSLGKCTWNVQIKTTLKFLFQREWLSSRPQKGTNNASEDVGEKIKKNPHALLMGM